MLPEITQEYLKSILRYDPESGLLFRKKDGSIAGGETKDKSNTYIRLRIKGYKYRAHRLAFLYMTGEIPRSQIDHINGNGKDNRWDNLRIVDNIQNAKNQKTPKNNSSGIMGVHKHYDSWIASITADKKRIYLGRYADFFEACCARKSAANKYDFHPNHGRKI